MALDLFTAGTVLPAPTGARVLHDLTYFADERGPLLLDAYLPAAAAGRSPAVLLVNGDADEQTIARAKDWAVYRSYGEHLAARGLVGVPFAHHSTEQGRHSADVADEIAAAIIYVRTHASDLEVDPDRLGVWVFSAAGTFALAPILRDRPQYVRAVAGFYTIWDLAPFRDLPEPPPQHEVGRWSATVALGASAQGLAPIFVGRAGRDSPRIKAGTDLFVARALALDADLEVHGHPTGQHGFDIRDDDQRTRGIISAALDFFSERLEQR
jgi:dienelactone hydrolase